MNGLLQKIPGPFLWLSLSAVMGILWSYWVQSPWQVFLPTILPAALAAGLAGEPTRRLAALVICTIATFALLHSTRRMPEVLWHFSPEVAELQAVVISDPLVLSEEPGEPPEVTFLARPAQWQQASPQARAFEKIAVDWLGQPPVYGQVIEIRGRLQRIPPPRNPSTRDRRKYLALNGVHGELLCRYPQDCRALPGNRGNPALRLGFWLRAQAAGVLSRGIAQEDEVIAVLHGLLLGVRDFPDPDLPRLFRETGTLHLFAVSGLHVGMWALVLWFLLKRVLRLPLQKRIWVLIPLLILYALVTGFRPPIVRATVMAVIVLFGVAALRRPRLLNSIAAAAFLLLAFDPNQLFLPGFQFSFVVVTGIVLLTPWILAPLTKITGRDPFKPAALDTQAERLGHKVVDWFAGIFAASAAAFLVSLPLTLWHFRLLTPYSVFTNVLAIPLTFGIVILGILTLLTALTGPWLPALLNHLNVWLVKALLAVIHASWVLPGSHGYFALNHGAPPPGHARVTVFALHFSQSAILIETTDQTWLIDGGGDENVEWILRPALESLGINRLDALLLTHGDSTHIGGAAELREAFRPAQVLVPAATGRSRVLRDFRETLRHSGRPARLFAAGETLSLAENISLTILHPPADLEERLADDRAAVLLLQVGNSRALFMGDAGFSTEQVLKTRFDPRSSQSTVMIYNEHSDDFFGTTAWITHIAPRHLILTGTTPPLWSPSPDDSTPTIHRTSQTGAVVIALAPEEIEVQPFFPRNR